MNDTLWAILSGAVIQFSTAAFVYGRLTERVKTLGDCTVDHGRRITNLENVQNGPGGQGERIAGLETWKRVGSGGHR
jgi:hypothetical protein